MKVEDGDTIRIEKLTADSCMGVKVEMATGEKITADMVTPEIWEGLVIKNARPGTLQALMREFQPNGVDLFREQEEL